jgi:hypothetical protein
MAASLNSGVEAASEILWGVASEPLKESSMPKKNDLSKCLIPFRQDETLVAVVEMSKTGWLVAGIIPGVERHPMKKLVPDETALLQLLVRWRDEAITARKARSSGVRGGT